MTQNLRPRPTDWSLDKILSHQSGDSWNGTHDRSIMVVFDDKDNLVTVINHFSGDAVAARFPLDVFKNLIGSKVAEKARYFRDFAHAAKHTVPSLMVEGDAARVYFKDEEDKAIAKAQAAERVVYLTLIENDKKNPIVFRLKPWGAPRR